jgi:FecR protein
MSIRRRIGMVAMVLMLVGVAWAPGQSWGQEDQRIGVVLAVDGTAEVRAANATTREPLQFRAALFPNDTVYTAANSKVKILLRDDSIMTLAERSEMQFTEFLLNPASQQRRTIVGLSLGTLRVVTTKIFGAGSTTEVRTANTVAGVRGTTFVVIFIPAAATGPEETEVISLEGTVTAQNPQIPQIEPVPANFRTKVIGFRAPTPATEVPVSIRQTLELGLRLTEQIPTEVKPTTERQAMGPVRGEPSTAGVAGLAGPVAPPMPRVAVLPAGVQPVAPDATAQLNQLVANTARINAAQASQPPNTQQQIITPDNRQTTTTIQQRQPTNLSITVSFPRN